jgi:hypothetical protein
MYGVYQYKTKVNGTPINVLDMNKMWMYLRFANMLRLATSDEHTFPNVKIVAAGNISSGTLTGTVTGNAAGLYYCVFIRGKGNCTSCTLAINRTPTIGSVGLGKIFRIAEGDFNYTITLAGAGLIIHDIFVVGFSYDASSPTFTVLS